MAGRLFARAIDSDMTGLDQRGRAGAGFDHPRMPQPFVETLALQATPLREIAGKVARKIERVSAILAIGGELFLERRQFGKGRIGIDRTIAIARRGAGRILPVRRAAAGAAVTVALVTSALVAATLVAAAAEFALKLAFGPVILGPILVTTIVVAFALEALARRTASIVHARLANHRRAIRGNRHGLGRRIGAGLSEILVAVAPSAPMPLVFGAFARLAGDGLACDGRLGSLHRAI